MNNRLDRTSLPVRLANIIEAEIKGGHWGESLAGHRTLMEHYSVSAKTCLAAIALLEDRKVISAAKHGKRRTILIQVSEQPQNLKELLIIDGSGAQSGEDLTQLQAYRAAWENTGGTVNNLKFDFPRYRRPAALLKEAVSSHKASAILLHVPPLAWVKAAAALRPVFLSGGEWQGTQITGVAYDLREAVAGWVSRLKALGHTRIMVPQDFIGPGMEGAVRQGVAQGLGIRENARELRDLCPVFSERLPGVWQQYWKKNFATVRPTAIILTDDIHYLSLSGFCFLNGIRIPKDLSVVCLESTEHLEWCEPVPTRMRFPVESATKYFRKWIRGGCRPMGMKFFPLDCIEAGTVAPASRR